jgi:malonate-semialdehyde dehydrogenase (acetylating)/methylmalonate-semialdehyde dehydrogenase
MDPSSEMGPLVTKEHRDNVASYVENAPGEGAEVLVDGREGEPGDGFFLRPSLLGNVKPGMKTYEEEIFGPATGR